MEWLTIFLINWLLNVLAIEYFALRKIKPILDGNKERDSKYKAFRRTDVKWFNRPWLYMTCHLCIPKIFFSFVNLCICGIISKIMVIGIKKEESSSAYSITGIRYEIMRFIQWWTSCVVLFGGTTCIWTFHSKPEICYKKYLGPDWKPDYDRRKVGCVVANHSSFLDTAINSKL